MKDEFVTLNGGFSRWVLGKSFCNRVYRIKDDIGYIPIGYVPVKDKVKVLRRLAGDVKTAGTKLLYVQLPDKVSLDRSNVACFEDSDGTFDAMDELLAILQKDGIQTLDVRPLVCQRASDIRKYFLSSDTHWNADGAFRAFESIAPCLIRTLGCTEERLQTAWERKRWIRRDFDRHVLGSLARRVGPLFLPPEPFWYFVPRFSTELVLSKKCQYSKLAVKKSGSFEDVFIFKEAMDDASGMYKDRFYDVVGEGNWVWLNTLNRYAPVKKRILIVADSYGRPVVSYLSTVFRQMRVIDYRTYRKKTIQEEIAEWQPDLVVLLSSGRTLANVMWWDFYLQRKGK